MTRKFIIKLLWMFVFGCLGISEMNGQTTNSPYVRSKNNSCTITKIELTDDETIVTIQVPNKKELKWVRFSSATVLVPSEVWDINDARRSNLDIPEEFRNWSMDAMLIDAIKRINEGRERFSKYGWLIRSLGRAKLDTKYKLNGKGPEFYYFELHFDRLPRGVEDVYIRELSMYGALEWVGIKINNPWPTVPNIGITEEQMKKRIDETNDGIVGIYEEIFDNKYKFKYKLACIFIDGVYKLIYLGGDNVIKNWSKGEVKATLHPSATPGFFKADWYMANKSINTDVWVVFEGGSMKTVIDGDEDGYIKMYPTAQPASSLNGTKQWSGTGFALKNGYVVTNHHVIDGAKSIHVQGVNGNFSIEYSASVVAADENNDLALLRIEDSSFSGFGSIPYNIKTSQAEVGEEIFVLGYPLTGTMGDEVKLTTGVISSRTGFQGDVSLYQISAPIQPGNSGGPLFDNKGNLVGIVNAKHTGAENVGYAIKASYLRNLVESYLSTSIMPSNNQVAGQPLTSQVKQLKDFVYMITCSNERTAKASTTINNPTNTSYANIDIYNPKVLISPHDGIKITRVQVTSDQTIVDFEFDNSKTHSGWVTISPYTYIHNAGTRYTMLKADGIPIEPEKHYFSAPNEKLKFQLIFPPLPNGATQFDLIESKTSTWKFYCIKLK